MRSYRDYRDGDLEAVDARFEVMTPELFTPAQLASSDMYTLTFGDEVVAVAGHTIVWPGLGEAWFHVSDEIRGHGPWIVKTVKMLLERSQKENDVRRTNALIHEDRPEYIKWCELLGFVGESYMAQAAPDGKGLFLMVKWRLN